MKDKIRYTKVITETRRCNECAGSGEVWEREYNNMRDKCNCYRCHGTGERNFTWSEDVTEEIESLITKSKNMKISEKFMTTLFKVFIIIYIISIVIIGLLSITSCGSTRKSHPAEWRFHKKTANNHKIKAPKVFICNKEV